MGTTEWRSKGACYGSYSPVFFPDTYGGKEAKAICNTCEVIMECLDFALRTQQKHGVWGGTTYSQRVKIRRLNRGPTKDQK